MGAVQNPYRPREARTFILTSDFFFVILTSEFLFAIVIPKRSEGSAFPVPTHLSLFFKSGTGEAAPAF
jgi:hypothetical protein